MIADIELYYPIPSPYASDLDGLDAILLHIFNMKTFSNGVTANYNVELEALGFSSDPLITILAVGTIEAPTATPTVLSGAAVSSSEESGIAGMEVPSFAILVVMCSAFAIALIIIMSRYYVDGRRMKEVDGKSNSSSQSSSTSSSISKKSLYYRSKYFTTTGHTEPLSSSTYLNGDPSINGPDGGGSNRVDIGGEYDGETPNDLNAPSLDEIYEDMDYALSTESTEFVIGEYKARSSDYGLGRSNTISYHDLHRDSIGGIRRSNTISYQDIHRDPTGEVEKSRM